MRTARRAVIVLIRRGLTVESLTTVPLKADREDCAFRNRKLPGLLLRLYLNPFCFASFTTSGACADVPNELISVSFSASSNTTWALWVFNLKQRNSPVFHSSPTVHSREYSRLEYSRASKYSNLEYSVRYGQRGEKFLRGIGKSKDFVSQDPSSNSRPSARQFVRARVIDRSAGVRHSRLPKLN